MNQAILKRALGNVVATTAYVALVALFLNHASRLFPNSSDGKVLIPIAMLLLLVFSAGLTGSLVFGQPVLWYLDGKKKEAQTLLTYTFATLFCMVVLAFAALSLTS